MTLQADNIYDLKEQLSRDLYHTRTAVSKLTDIIEKHSKHNILDEIDFQKEYIILLKELNKFIENELKNDTEESLLLVARFLQDPKYLSAWFENKL